MGFRRTQRGQRCEADAPVGRTIRLIVAQSSKSAVVRRKPPGLRYKRRLFSEPRWEPAQLRAPATTIARPQRFSLSTPKMVMHPLKSIKSV